MPTLKYDLKLQELTGSDKSEIAREALRYCPEFPFEPSVIEKVTNHERFYSEDYELVRISSGEQNRREVWGFYAPGDFHPIDGSGGAFEELNEIAPLTLNLATVLDYTLLRVRFELPSKFAISEHLDEFRPAVIICAGELHTEKLNELTEPTIVMAPEWELLGKDAPSHTQGGLVFRIVLFALVHHNSEDWKVVQVFAQIEPDGTLSIKDVDLSVSVPFGEPNCLVLSTEYTRTAMPIREWRSLDLAQAEQLIKGFQNEDLAVEFHESDLKDPAALVRKIRDAQDPVSAYLQKQFKSETLKELKQQASLSLPNIKTTLIAELNQILMDPSFCSEEDSERWLLPRKVQHELETEPTKYKLIRRNRSFLEDAYPDELVRKNIVLRQAKLTFYHDCEIVEVLVSRDRHYRRGYALVHFEGEDVKLYPLTGASAVIHTLNAEPNRLNLSETTVDDYLQFFCWAMHGEEGPFYVPLSFREIPLVTAPSRKQCKELRQIDFRISHVTELERKEYNLLTSESVYLRKSLVAYASGLFHAWFSIAPNGAVNMLRDEPQVTDLVIYQDRYGLQAEKLIPLKVRENSESQSSPPPHDLTETMEEPNKDEIKDEASEVSTDQETPLSETVSEAKLPTNSGIDQESIEPVPEILGELSVVTRAVFYVYLKNIQEVWSSFAANKEVSSTDAPKIGSLKKILDEIPEEQASKNAALRFLKAPALETSPRLTIRTAIFRKALEDLICEIRPKEKATAKEFLQKLSKTSFVSKSLVGEDVVLNTKSIDPSAQDDASELKAQPTITISECWFTGGVRLTELENGPALVFESCVFERGVFAQEAKIGKGLIFRECVFGGNALNIEKARISGDLLLRGCSLEGTFYAPGLRAENDVQLIACGIASSLEDIRKTQTVKEMLDRKWPDPEGEFEQRRQQPITAINLQGARINGNLEIRASDRGLAFNASRIAGTINCNNIFIGLNLFMFGTSCQKGMLFIGAQVSKNVDFTMLRTLDGDLEFYGAIIAGAFSLGRASINGTVSLYQAKITGNLILLGLKVTGDLKFTFAKFGGFVAAYHTSSDEDLPYLTVGGDVILSGAEANVMELRGAEIGGAIQIRTGKFGRLIMALGAIPEESQTTDANVKNELRFVPKPCRASVLEITSVVVEEGLDLSGLVVTLPPDERKASRLRMDNEGVAVLINNSHIGKDLIFFNEKLRLHLERRWKKSSEQRLPWRNIPTAPQMRSFAWGKVVLKANKINSEIDLRNMEVTGDIDLTDTTVRFDVNVDGGDPSFEDFKTNCNNLLLQKLDCSGDVKVSGLRARRHLRAREAQIKGEVLFLPMQTKERLANGERVELDEKWMASIGGDLDLSSTAIRGDLDLRNLKVGKDILVNDASVGLDLNMDQGSFADHATTCKNINAEGLTCNGDVKLSGLMAIGDFRGRGMQISSDITFSTTTDNNHPHHARIGGYVDLTAAKANRLKLSGVTLGENLYTPDVNRKGPANEQDHARLRLERSQIGHLEIMKPPVLGRVNLSGISVTHWAFSSSNGDFRDGAASGDDYIEVLNDQTPFDRSTWIDVEKALRNQSLIGDANKVYREMRKRIKDDKSSLKPTLWLLWDSLQSSLIGYGTRVWIPMIPALLFLFVSLFIFSNPTYVRASGNLLAVLDKETRASCNVECQPNELGHVWDVRDGVALALRYHVPILTSLTHGSWEASHKPLPGGLLTAEHYAFIVEVYHWIAWPIFLLGAAAQVFRGRQN